MSRQRVKAKNRITQRMTKDGLIERNESTGDDKRVSKRDVDFDLHGTPSEGDIKDVSIAEARSTRQKFSGSERKPNASTNKRNKRAYRRHQSNMQKSKPPAQQTNSVQDEPSMSNTPTQKHDVVAVVPRNDSNMTHQQGVPPPISSNLPQPRASPPQALSKLQDQHPDNGKLKTKSSTPFSHDKASVLQNAPAAHTLRHKKPAEPTLKHKRNSSAPIPQASSKTGMSKTALASAIQGAGDVVFAQGENNEPKNEALSSVELAAQATQQTYSQVGNKSNNTHVADIYNQNQPSTIKQKRPKTNSALLHSDNEPAKPLPQAEAKSKPINASIQNTDSPQATSESNLQTDKEGKLKFGGDESAPAPPKSRRLVKAEKSVNHAHTKLDKAKDKLPAKKKYRSRLVFDEQKGKSKREFFVEKEVKSQAEHLKGPPLLRPVKAGANSALNFGHSKIFQVEHENVEIKAAHRGEMTAEGGVRGILRHHKARKYRKVAKLERALMKKNVNLTYRQALEKNPKLKSNMFSRMWQKRKIKKQYAQAARESRRVAGGVKKVGSLTLRTARLAVRVVLKSPKVIALLIVAGLTFAMIMSLITLFMSLGGGGLSAVIATSYLSDEADIDNAALAYTEWEVELLTRIANAQTDFPDFDEYRFNVDMIDHNPHELMAYLTAAHHIFTYPEIRGALRELFDAQYQLSFTPSVEIRHYEDYEGNLIPYEWRVMTVTLTSHSLSDIIHERLTDDQRQHFNLLMLTSGHRQIVGSPFAFDWRPFVTSNYGWRIHPITGNPDLHRGIDIGLPTGTPILAAHDGIITFAGWMSGFGNVIFIAGENGIETRYAHCDTILVSVGQEVSAGDVIATVGSTGDSTGPHLHFEILRDGVHLNPIFFAHTNAGIGGPIFGNPGLPMGDGTFEALLALGQSLFGRPYVWGASGPNSFDCSGLIYFLLNQSGAANVPRTTAQGYFNMSRPVYPSEAQPGDLIFFERTFSSPRLITHVGVYLGNGQMLHTGSNPNGVEIVSINTPFWQRHFHGFGRIVDF